MPIAAPSSASTARAAGSGASWRTSSGWPASTPCAARPDAEPVDVGVMASATADRFGVVAEARGLTLAVEVAPGDHVVAIPPDWLDRLLGVLVDNACKFAPDGSTVRIAVGDRGGRG